MAGSPAGNVCGGAVVGSPDDSGRGVVALSLDSVGGSPGVRGRGFVIKDSGTVAAVLSMIQAVNGGGGAVVDSVGRPKANYSLHNPPPLGCAPMGSKELLKGRPLYGVSRTP